MKNILIVSLKSFEKAFILKYLTDLNPDQMDIIQADTVEAAEQILFETVICLIIIEWNLEGAVDFTYNLKSDEMFRMLPVIALVRQDDQETLIQLYLKGVDNYIRLDEVPDRLPLMLRPLIVNNVLNEELVQKNSLLQEQAIHDFILLDLIKKYIPRTIWDMANTYAHEQKIHIPEEERELTIAFGDIKEFTAMAQHLAPIDVIRNLNAVFEIVTRIIYAHHGDIDKFIGDAFLAVFEDPAQAVAAMVQVQKEIEVLNRKRVENHQNPILFRIGIHTGAIIRGNVGGDGRYDNTLIGDTVNMASRLESLSKPGDILISETARAKAKLDIHPDRQFKVKIKGRDVEEIVYQVYELLKDKY